MADSEPVDDTADEVTDESADDNADTNELQEDTADSEPVDDTADDVTDESADDDTANTDEFTEDTADSEPVDDTTDESADNTADTDELSEDTADAESTDNTGDEATGESVEDDSTDTRESPEDDVTDSELVGDTVDADSLENRNEDSNNSTVFRELKPIDDKLSVADRNSDILDWEGEKGNSKRVPKDSESELRELLSAYGIDGIEYRNGDVDFSPVSKYDMDFEDEEALYRSVGENIPIGKLLTDEGSVSRDKFNSIIRNEWQKQAKRQMVDRINSDSDFASDFQQKTGIDTAGVRTVSDLNSELKRNNLTIHETPDCKKIQLIPTKIHDTFKHSGGTAEMLERLIDADTHSSVFNKNITI